MVFGITLDYYEYRMKSHGLTNAPLVIEALISDVAHDMLGTFFITYIDGILIYQAFTMAPIRKHPKSLPPFHCGGRCF